MVVTDCFSLGWKTESAQVLGLTYGPFLFKNVIGHRAGQRRGALTSAPCSMCPQCLGSGAVSVCFALYVMVFGEAGKKLYILWST